MYKNILQIIIYRFNEMFKKKHSLQVQREREHKGLDSTKSDNKPHIVIISCRLV